MKLYREVPITSAEQAEALPEGTFAVRWDVPWIGEKVGPDENGHTEWQSKNGCYSHVEMIGDTALVPIEAEEETHDYIKYGAFGGSPDSGTRTRLVTPWEEA